MLDQGAMQVGKVAVRTVNHSGHSVQHWAERCLDKIVYVSEDSDSIVTEQAKAFKNEIRVVINAFMNQAVKSDRTTLYNVLLKAGYIEAAELIRRL